MRRIAAGLLLAIAVTVAALLALRQGRAADDSWARCGQTIAHAFGALGDRIYTNTREAFAHGYARGFRVFEVDLAFSSDSQVILAHDWHTPRRQPFAEPPSRDVFVATPVYDSLQALDVDSLAHLANSHSDVWFMLDFKGDVPRLTRALVARFNTLAPRALARLVPQIKSQSELEPVLAAYPFPSVAYTLYASDDSDAEVRHFVVRERIGVVIVSDTRFSVPLMRELRRRGIAVYVHTLNTQAQVDLFREWGASGAMTDVLMPDSVCPERASRTGPTPAGSP